MATLIGTPGNDFLVGTADSDLILGLAGNDTEIGLGGVDSLFGNEGQDVISGGTGDDLINGNQDNDLINGNQGDDTINGGQGNDIIYGGKGNDLLYGDKGNDTIFGNLGDDTIFGGEGADVINGNQGNDLINGNQGNDTIYGGQNDDTIFGGQDNDLLYGDKGNDIIFGNLGDDTIFGGDGADYINGNEGNDLLLGNQGNDTIFGGQGNDTIFGGQDNDILYGDKGNDTIFGNLGNDTIYGGDGADYINGNQGNDTLYGNEGNDTIYGGQGDDIIRGGKGNDLIFGDKGSDTIFGDIGADTLTGNDGDAGTPDLFVIGLTGDPTAKTTGGSTIANADVITDWDICIDQISLEGGLTYNDLVVQQGTGANAADTVISVSSSFKGNGAGEYLAVLKNVNANSIDGTSFIDSNGQFGPARAIIAATDPTAVEPVTTPNGTLQNNGEFTVIIPCDAPTDIPITYTVATGTGQAIPGVDYQALSGVVVIPKGSDRVTIPVIPLGSTLTTSPETVTVTLDPKGSSFVSTTPQTATVNIFNATVTNKPTVFVTAPSPTAKEGSGQGSFQFARSGGDITQLLRINYIVSGTATPNTDYTPALSGNVTIPANQTVSSIIPITALTDSINEPTETVVVSTQQDSNYIVGSQSSATVSIIDNNPLTGTPGAGPILRYNSSGAFQANEATIQTAINNATAGDIIVIPAGNYPNQAINVNKSVTLRGPNAGLSPGAGSLGPQAVVSGDNSVAPIFTISSPNVTIEGVTIQGTAPGSTANQNLIQATTNDDGLVIRQNQFSGTGPANGGVIRVDFVNSPGSATIQDNLIRDVSSGTVTSAIQAFRMSNATITNNVVANLTGPGIVTDSITGQALIINNSVSNVRQEGIGFAGGNATISSNNVTNADLSNDPNRGGIRLRNSGFNPTTSTLGNVNVTSNVITNSFNGLAIRPLQAGDPTSAGVAIPNTVRVNQNNVIGNSNAGLLNGGVSGTLDATNNWWGVATGPVVGGTGQNAIINSGGATVNFNSFATTPF